MTNPKQEQSFPVHMCNSWASQNSKQHTMKVPCADCSLFSQFGRDMVHVFCFVYVSVVSPFPLLVLVCFLISSSFGASGRLCFVMLAFLGNFNYISVRCLKNIMQIQRTSSRYINPCPADKIKMPRPLLIFSQSDYLIKTVAINSHACLQTV